MRDGIVLAAGVLVAVVAQTPFGHAKDFGDVNTLVLSGDFQCHRTRHEGAPYVRSTVLVARPRALLFVLDNVAVGLSAQAQTEWDSAGGPSHMRRSLGIGVVAAFNWRLSQSTSVLPQIEVARVSDYRRTPAVVATPLASSYEPLPGLGDGGDPDVIEQRHSELMGRAYVPGLWHSGHFFGGGGPFISSTWTKPENSRRAIAAHSYGFQATLGAWF